jgi:2-C-methyl-D-erythritol 2,4-cyclodiphosphate synthase
MKIGNGYDVHKLIKNRKLILGGVEIPHDKGLLGHSDADVVTHAIMDALLGSLALGSIGDHFPDSDDKYKNIVSLQLLKKVSEIITKKGYKIINLDSVIVAQKPKLQNYIPEMRQNIARILKVTIEQVSVKATTTEKLGFTGKEQGIAAYAVVLLDKC